MLYVSYVLSVCLTLLLNNEEAQGILKKSGNFEGYVNRDLLKKLIDAINDNDGDRTNVDNEFKGLDVRPDMAIMKQLQKNYDYKEMAEAKDITDARVHIIENSEVLNQFLAEMDRKDQEEQPKGLPPQTTSQRRRGHPIQRRRGHTTQRRRGHTTQRRRGPSTQKRRGHSIRRRRVRRRHNRKRDSKRRNSNKSHHHDKRFRKFSRESDGGKKKRHSERSGKKDKLGENGRHRKNRFGGAKRFDKKDNSKGYSGYSKENDKKNKRSDDNYKGYSKENDNNKDKRLEDAKWFNKKDNINDKKKTFEFAKWSNNNDKYTGYSKENEDIKKKPFDNAKWFDKRDIYKDYSKEIINKKKPLDDLKRFDIKNNYGAMSKEKFSKKEIYGENKSVREKFDAKNIFEDREKRPGSRENKEMSRDPYNKKTIRSRVDDYDYNGDVKNKNDAKKSILTVDLEESVEKRVDIPLADSYYPPKSTTKDWLANENRKPIDKIRNDNDNWGNKLKNDNENWAKPVKNDNEDWGKTVKNDNWGKPLKNNNDDWGKSVKNDNWGKPVKNYNDDWGKPLKNDNDNWGKPVKIEMLNPGAPMPRDDFDLGGKVEIGVMNQPPHPNKSYEDNVNDRYTTKESRDFFNKFDSTTRATNNDWGRPVVKYENKYKYNMERLYDYDYSPKRKPSNREGYSFGRTPIPYIGRKGVYAEN